MGPSRAGDSPSGPGVLTPCAWILLPRRWEQPSCRETDLGVWMLRVRLVRASGVTRLVGGSWLQQTSHRAGGLSHWVHSWRLCGNTGALTASPGPLGALWGPAAWLESAQTQVGASVGFLPCGLPANSVCGLLPWREQDRGQGSETAQRGRAGRPPTLHSLQGAF